MSDGDSQDDWRTGFGLYASAQPEAAQDRAVQLAQVVRLTPILMPANLVCGILVVAVRPQALDLSAMLWLGMLFAGAMVALRAWWSGRGRVRERASLRALRQANVHAAWMGACWGLGAALWFAGLTGPAQVVMATIMTGMLGSGAVALSPLPRASATYVISLSLGALVALWRTGDWAYAPVALALCCYSVVVVWTAWGLYRRQRMWRLAQREGERQGEVVSLLLKEFEDNASDALWETDASGRLVRRSARLEALLGLRGDALDEIRLPEWFLGASQGGPTVVRAWREAMPFRAAKLHWRRGEQSQWWQLSGRPIRDADANLIGWRGVISDITEAQRYEDQLREQADHDLLTGLPNRRRLAAAIEDAAQRGMRGWLLSIDLDHFKLINDTSGHSVGDEVLREVGHRISACVGVDDLAVRLGGDEFALLRLSGNPDAPPMGLANQLIRSLSQPVSVGVKQLHVGASIGLAPVRGREEDAEELLVNADMALYHAKRTGRGRAEVYGPELGEANRRMNRIEVELREGLDKRQLYLNFQPKVDASRLSPTGVEALMRWQHPTLGLVSPGDFITAAERCGLIHELGEFALHEACLAVKALGGLTVAVNVSPVQLMGSDFESVLRGVLTRTGVAPHFLELEVTESVMLDDARGALARLHALRRLGVRVALDDFGTGYSSLSYLRAFPFDTLKIDRSFVRGLGERGTRTIVQSMLQMAQGLGMKTVVEGVETPEQMHGVQELGCDEVQGFLVARPMPLHQVIAWQKGQKTDLLGDSVDSRIPAWWHSTAPAGFLDGR